MLALLTAIATASTLAVLPFDEGSAPDDLDGFGHALSAMLTTDFTLVEGITVVERGRLDDILAELDLSKTEFVDKKTAVSMGKGLAADHVVTGVYSVIGEDLVLDARIIHVESGKVARAGRAQGPLSDFVGVEKKVVDILVEDLALTLTGAAHRKIIGRTETENLDAFSKYGKGLLEQREGDAAAAKAAFEAALVADPAFAEAKEALARVEARVVASVAGRTQAKLDAKKLHDKQALMQSVDERDRKKSFRHTEESVAEWLLRLDALKSTEQHCVRYEEMLAYARREGLPDDRYSWPGLPSAIAHRGVAMGRWKPDPGWEETFAPQPPGHHPPPLDWAFGQVPYELARVGRRPGEFIWDIYGWVGDPADMERGKSDGILGALHGCYEGDEEVRALRALIATLDGDPALDRPYSDYEHFSVADGLRAHLASTMAWKQGPSAEVEATADWLLAEAEAYKGTDEEFHAQSLAQRIVGYGKRWTTQQERLREDQAKAEMSKRKRLGYDEPTLVGILEALVRQDPERIVTSGLCEHVVGTKSKQAQSMLDRLSDSLEDGRDPKWVYDEVWHTIASTRDLGCLAGTDGRFSTISELYAFVDAVKLPEEPSRDCRTWVRNYAAYQNPGARMDPEQFPQPATMYATMALDEYYRLELMGCLD